MAFDGSGNYVPPSAPAFPSVSGNIVSSIYYNQVVNDLATNGISQCLTRDGQGKPSGPIGWNNQNLTGVATLSATTGNFVTANFTNALGLASGGTGLTTATPAAGALLIGTGTGYNLATLIAGAGIIVTNAAGSITIAAAVTGAVVAVSGGTTGLIFTGTTSLTMSGILAVANGGNGTSSTTGTGSVVFSTGPTISNAVLTGGPTAVTLAAANSSTGIATTAYVKSQNYVDANAALSATATVGGNLIGYLDLVGTTQAGAYTLALTDRGQTIIQTGNLTIPANATVAFPIRTVITIITTAAITISITTDTLNLVGTASTGTRNAAAKSVVALIKDTATSWIISGGGVT